MNTRRELKKVCKQTFDELTHLVNSKSKTTDDFLWSEDYVNFSLAVVKDPNMQADVYVSYNNKKDFDKYLDSFNSLGDFIKYCKIL